MKLQLRLIEGYILLQTNDLKLSEISSWAIIITLQVFV